MTDVNRSSGLLPVEVEAWSSHHHRIQLTNGQLKVGPVVICRVCGAEFRVRGDDDLDDEE
jgi:hypothetical protein